MKLLLINGSPRGTKSNTRILFEKFCNGIDEANRDIQIEFRYLNKLKQHSEIYQAFLGADAVIMGFPLYTDAMPGIVMQFIEHLPKSPEQTVGFIVQSGFPEAIHSIFIERYLNKLSQRMEWNYLGTIIKGGVEGIQIMPERMNRKLFSQFRLLGRHFATKKQFNNEIVADLRKPMRLSPARIRLLRVLSIFGITNFYWNKKLKENNAYAKRFDAPYTMA